MIGIENYGLFLLSAVLLNITPGADTMYILGRSISQGQKAGIVSVLGISSGLVLHTLLASLGLSIILAKSVAAFNIVKFAGAFYLIYLGIKTVKASSGTFTAENSQAVSLIKIYFQGVLTNVLNPKVALFFLAFLPQFVAAGNNFGPLPFLFLGLTFITTGTIWCLIVAVLSSLVSQKLRSSEGTLKFINKLTGLLFIGLGLNLFSGKMAK